MAVDQNLRVDQASFEHEQTEHSRKSRGSSEAANVFEVGPLDALKEGYRHGNSFLGYERVSSEGKVIGILAQGHLAESACVDETGPSIALVLDQTPFYGESGGQVGDLGLISATGFRFHVTDTKKENDFTLHIGRVIAGSIALGATVYAEVDLERRQAIRRAHSATHVLHHALHIHLGKHAQQAGSKVEPDRLRFDFSNPEAVGKERLRLIEDTVNDRILLGETIDWSSMPIAEARQLGAMALFGEKYPEVVRVVRMGEFSRELCGGTHLANVAQVGLFKIVAEESVASGTRRITALTGKAARELIKEEETALNAVSSVLKVQPTAVGERVAALLDEIKSLKKQAGQRRSETAPKTSSEDLLATAVMMNDTYVIVTVVEYLRISGRRLAQAS